MSRPPKRFHQIELITGRAQHRVSDRFQRAGKRRRTRTSAADPLEFVRFVWYAPCDVLQVRHERRHVCTCYLLRRTILTTTATAPTMSRTPISWAPGESSWPPYTMMATPRAMARITAKYFMGLPL